MNNEPVVLRERSTGPISKVVGLYQTLLRRSLEHFFPDGILEAAGDRSFIEWDGASLEEHYRVGDDPDGLGVEIEWFRSRYLYLPGSPAPFLPAERHLIEVILEALDLRFRGLFDLEVANRIERFHYASEDLILSDYLGGDDHFRIPAALEALRVAALSTYENRRVSLGTLLLGTPYDPAAPEWVNPEGAPRFNTRLTAIKGFHRLCDGVQTLFIVDQQGELTRTVDIGRWAEKVQGSAPLETPCPRAYVNHAKATRSGGHLCLVLTPSQEIKVFAEGVLTFAFSDARWRLLDIPTKFAAWCKAIGKSCPSDLALRIFQAALNLAEDRKGALFVVLRDPGSSIPQLIAPADRIVEEVATDDPHDPENLSPRMAKQSLHHVARDQTLAELDATVLEALAGIDGAVVTDLDGRLLTFGAILKIDPEALKIARAVEGARTLAAIAASYHGPVIKVSEDGYLTMYLGGRRVWGL
ncbi:DisA checkpoint controller nucleotide-binding [Singulisphaera sp. GP187]|uniref:diadenylate cyclase n=1 Tax=Singulisphaera sp. GP187 TaxID=1882752 RepID=UPI000928683B|nr:diadenylate cyclase [Singulisphaera sp. GP187]SIN79767.1 DisA checkpoint controller nucleotide-binding [Singulisphaera sp. GP187]